MLTFRSFFKVNVADHAPAASQIILQKSRVGQTALSVRTTF